MSGKALRIFGLKADNFMRLECVSVELDGSPVVRVVGHNDQGKTSFLEVVASALGGEKMCPKVPIRRGADKAEISVDLGEFIATRRWALKNEKVTSDLTVKSRDGMRYPSPQALLDKLIGKLSFDPLAFTRAKPAEQVETLKTLVGLDFRLLDAQRKTAYDQRTEVNRDVVRMRGQLETMKIVEAPDEPVSVEALLKEQDAQVGVQREHDALKHAAEAATQARVRADDRVTRAKEALAKAQKELAEAETATTKAKESEEEAAGEYAVAQKPDLAAVREKLAKAEQTNSAVRLKKERAAVGEKLRAKEKEAAALTEKVEAADKSKADALGKAQFPVEGLSFSDEGVTLNDVPFEQASAANQLRVSLAIGLSINPTLKVVLIRDGSLLDDNSMRIVAEMAEEAGAQVLIERVWREGEIGIYIEDGHVVPRAVA